MKLPILTLCMLGVAHITVGQSGGGQTPAPTGAADPSGSDSGLPAGVNLITIEGGTFTMGVDKPETDLAYPAHEVTVSSFQMSETLITNEQYVEFLNAAMGQGLIKVEDKEVEAGGVKSTQTFVFGTTGNAEDYIFIQLSGTRVLKDHDHVVETYPVDPENPLNMCFIQYDATASTPFSIKNPADIDWERACDDVLAFDMPNDYNDWKEELTTNLPSLDDVKKWPANFIYWYGAKEFATFYECDLPTEAQWEYAAKANQNLQYPTETGEIDENLANYNEKGLGTLATRHVTAVKSYPANPFGLFDMAGNTWEWLEDWYLPYSSEAQTDPVVLEGEKGSKIGSEILASAVTSDAECSGTPGQDYNCDAHIKRGGSWNYHSTTCQSTYRERDYTWRGNDHFGFRIAKKV